MTVPLRVLIVEDEGIVALDIRNRVRRMGHEVVGSADSGEEAIDMALEARPDLILMDIRLKGIIDGIEAVKRIRQTFAVPIVYLTAYADEPTRERAAETEPSGYLNKPFEDSDLREIIGLITAELSA